MNKTAKTTLIYMVGTIVVAVLGFANTMILTRVLTTRIYAMYGLLATFVTAATTFLSMGYHSSYIRFYYCHGYTQKRYMFECLKVPVLFFCLFLLLLLEPKHRFVQYIFESDFSWNVIFILACYVFLALLHRFSQATARMEECALNFIVSNVIGKSGFLAIVLLLFYIKRAISFADILLSFGISSLIAVAINAVVFVKVGRQRGDGTSPTSQKILFNYGFPIVINNTLILIIPMIEKLIIRELSGWEVLSIYTAASIFETIIAMLAQMVDSIWLPVVYRLYVCEERFKPIFHTFGLGISVLMTVGLALCILGRRWLVLFLGDAYYKVYVIAPAVLFGACFNVIATVYSVGINIQKKTIHYVISPLIQILFSVILCYLLIPKWGLVGVASASISSIFISRLYRIVVGLRAYDSGEKEYKSFCLWGICMLSSFVSMLQISLLSDIVLCIMLLIAMMLIVNKDCFHLYQQVLLLIKEKNGREK